MRWWLSVVALGGCPGPAPGGTCRDLCAVLMFDCGFEAYPDPGSCEQGCRFEASLGADLRSLEACVADAGCDTAEVLSCSRAYGGAE